MYIFEGTFIRQLKTARLACEAVFFSEVDSTGVRSVTLQNSERHMYQLAKQLCVWTIFPEISRTRETS